MANSNNKHSKDFFKRLPISSGDEGLREIRDRLQKVSRDHAAGKIVGRMAEEIELGGLR